MYLGTLGPSKRLPRLIVQILVIFVPVMYCPKYVHWLWSKKKKEVLAVKQRGNVFLCIIWMCSSIKQLVWIDGFHLHIKCKSSFSFRWYFFICVVCKYSWHDFSSQMSFSWESVLTVHLCLCMLLVNMSSMTMHQFIQ